jgi:hypothetical protein
MVPSVSKLLTRLEFTAATSNAPLAGDTFTVSLIDSASTLFVDPTITDIPYVGDFGTITITASESVVPEPATLGLVCVGGVGLAAYQWCRRRAVCPDREI